MATIETRINADGTVSYRVKIRIKPYPAESRTFSRKTDARDWAAQRTTEIKRGKVFGIARKSLGEAVERYLKEELGKLSPKLQAGRRRHLLWWRDQLGARCLVSDIARPLVNDTLSHGLPGRKFATRNPTNPLDRRIFLRYAAALVNH